MSLTLNIHDLNHDGEGVAYHDGFTYFVADALPGESVEATPFLQKKRFGRAKLEKVLTPSADREIPPCPYFGVCGGCQLMHLSYEKQLEFKTKRVGDTLKKIGKIEVDPLPCLPSDNALAYRNKIQLPVRKEGIGLYKRNSNQLVPIDACKIHCDLGESVFYSVQEVIGSIAPYQPETGEGELRHVLIKTAVHTGQVLVIFVTNQNKSPALIAIAKELMQKNSAIKGIVHNKQEARGNVILGKDFSSLEGELYIEETLLDLKFKVSPPSFFQVNPGQAEKLYSKCLEFADLQGDETVLDAYCGVGTLSLVFASQAKKVIGVECVKEAIIDAKENAKLNGIKNATFHTAKAEEFIQTVKGIDVVLLNPPRKGCDIRMLQALFRLSPKKILYVSCDPATLARDLQILEGFQFKTEQVQPFDMFPQTAHVETLALLSRP